MDTSQIISGLTEHFINDVKISHLLAENNPFKKFMYHLENKTKHGWGYKSFCILCLLYGISTQIFVFFDGNQYAWAMLPLTLSLCCYIGLNYHHVVFQSKENIEKNTQAITTERTERIQEVQRLDGRIDGLSNRIDELDGRIDKVGALAVAMAGLHPLEYDPDAPTQFSMAAGTYSGESAIAAGLFHNPNKDVLLSVGFSISGSEKAANVGATFRFGRSSESKARKVIEDKQREQELAAQAAAARQKTVSYRVEQILAEDTAKAE